MTDRLDEAIDHAVREMLDVEPPAGLRARVMQRIEEPVASGFSRKVSVASAFRRKIMWAAVPVAAVALIVMVVLLSRRDTPGPSLVPTAPSIATANPQPQVLPPPVRTVPPPAATPPTRVARLPEASRPRERQRVVTAALAEPAPAEEFPRVPSLSVPALTMSEIRGVAPAEPAQIGVGPIAAPAPLEIEPLPLSPRERQNQE